MITDGLRSYSAARRKTLPSVPHVTDRYASNRAEVSHQPTRERERRMRRFKSSGQAPRFLAAHAAVGNLFRIGRHLMRAKHYLTLGVIAGYLPGWLMKFNSLLGGMSNYYYRLAA